ncbi:hypothetical protein [Legionella sp. CNM-4043-24]|uniref:hypothetical protein n=1 Tax=Legionella sp. CNM-4043-24 TaxID=3421646 RepID=UPI00403B0595
MKWITLLSILLGLSACSHLETELTENPQVVAAPMHNSTAPFSNQMPYDVTDTMINHY